MFSVDLAIKFGSNEIIVYRKGIGIVTKEPAYLAVVENGKSLKVKASGKEAEQLFFSHANDITVYQPIENSEIKNEKMATLLMSHIVNKVVADKTFLTRINAIVAVPCALNEMQLIMIKRVLVSSGINKVTFVQNSVCAKANLDLEPNAHIMVVDIGKFVTDISVLSDYSFDFGRMFFVGGQDMDKSITVFVEDNFNLQITDMASEAIKNDVASLYENDKNKIEFYGLNNQDRFEKKSITASEVKLAIVNVYNKIFEQIINIMRELPKELVAEINQNGIMFVGGGSCIAGFYEFAKKFLNLPIIVPDCPSDSVILGAGKLLNEKDFLKIDF